MNLSGKGSEEELGGVEGGKIIIRTHFMKKKSIFNKGEKVGRTDAYTCACV